MLAGGQMQLYREPEIEVGDREEIVEVAFLKLFDHAVGYSYSLSASRNSPSSYAPKVLAELSGDNPKLAGAWEKTQLAPAMNSLIDKRILTVIDDRDPVGKRGPFPSTREGRIMSVIGAMTVCVTFASPASPICKSLINNDLRHLCVTCVTVCLSH